MLSVEGASVGLVQHWTGREARALRLALRMSVRAFAAHLGVSDRTVSKWEALGEQIVPLPESQALLDTALEQGGPDVQLRFRVLIQDSSPATAPSPNSFSPVPVPEPGLVHRSADYAGLVTVLEEALAADGMSTVALYGPGGFGKTTLATQICGDPRIREAFPEIYWVETGYDCTPARIVALIADLCVHLDGHRPAFTDPEQAGFHLAWLLRARRALLVIDNVWSAADLSPFLLGGEHCVRLVTTRNLRVCPTSTRAVRLGPMSTQEISELLTRTISGFTRQDGVQLAHMCGGWPLLASVVGANIAQDLLAGAPTDRALAEADEALRLYGPTAFDVWDADQRKNAIGHAIDSSLRSLDDNVLINGGTGLRDRYLSLAIFPPAQPIPLTVLAHWWKTAFNWSPIAVRQFCRVLADRSLVSSYLADRGAITLHDVFRSYLRHLLADDWEARHQSLLDTYRHTTDGQWDTLDASNNYLWRTLPYHLHEAGADTELVDLLANPQYVVTKVGHVGHQALTADALVLNSLAAQHQKEHPQHHAWMTAKTMTSAGYLLSGLDRSTDIATTLAVALHRASEADAAQSLIPAHGHGPAFTTGWVHASGPPQPNGGTPEQHVGAVVSVSSVGHLAASGGEDGAVRLWNLDEHRLLRVHWAHTGWVFATELSPDGTVLASAGEDTQVRLWNTDTGEPIGVLTGHTRRIRALAFSDNGALLISGAEDGTVCVWDVVRNVLVHRLRTPGTPVWSVAVGNKDSLVAVAGEDEFVRLYDLASGELLDEQARHRDWVRSVAFAPDSALLASGSGDRAIQIWNVSQGRLAPIHRIDDLPARVRAVALHSSGERVLAATEDAVLHSLPVEEGASWHVQMPPGVDWVRALAQRGDGRVVAACEDGGIRLWNPAAGDRLTALSHGANTVWSTQFAADGHLAVVADGDGTVELFDAATAAPRGTLEAGSGRVWSLAANTAYVVAAGGEGTIRAWNLATDRHPLLLNEDVLRTWAVAVPRLGARLAASTGDGRIRCWDLPSGDLLWEQDVHAGRLRSLAFDDNGEILAACGGDGSVHLWQVGTGQHLSRFTNPGGWARTVTLDATGAHAAVGSGTGEITIRDLRSNRFLAHLAGHTGRILMLGFIAGGDQVVSAAADGTVRLWSVTEQRQLAEVRVGASLHCAAFDPATQQILVGGAAGVVTLTINS